MAPKLFDIRMTFRNRSSHSRNAYSGGRKKRGSVVDEYQLQKTARNQEGGSWGTEMVGDAIASKLIALGHEVMIARSAIRMQLKRGPRLELFVDAARFGGVTIQLNELDQCLARGEGRPLAGKTLIDGANVPPDATRTESLADERLR